MLKIIKKLFRKKKLTSKLPTTGFTVCIPKEIHAILHIDADVYKEVRTDIIDGEEFFRTVHGAEEGVETLDKDNKRVRFIPWEIKIKDIDNST